MKSKSELTVFIFIVGILICKAAAALGMPLADSTKTASDLISDAEKAVALIVKSGQASHDNHFDPGNRASEPFWASVKKLNTNIDKLNKYHFLKDDTFHKTLAESLTAKEELLTTFDMLGAADQGISEGVSKVSIAIDLLYQHYSKDALRVGKGDELTPRERQQLAQIKSKNRELQSKLSELERKVGDNEKMIKKIKKIKKKSKQVMHAQNNSAGFFFAMSAMHMMNGWMWGCHWWWGPWGGWYPGFYVGYVDIYIDVIDDYSYDWGYLDGVIDAEDFDLEIDVDDMEIDTMDEYLNDMEIADHSYDIEDLSLEGIGYPSQLDHFEPQIDYQEMVQPEMYHDFNEFDYGGYDDW